MERQEPTWEARRGASCAGRGRGAGERGRWYRCPSGEGCKLLAGDGLHVRTRGQGGIPVGGHGHRAVKVQHWAPAETVRSLRALERQELRFVWRGLDAAFAKCGHLGGGDVVHQAVLSGVDGCSRHRRALVRRCAARRSR